MNLRVEVIKNQIAICTTDVNHYQFLVNENPDKDNYKSLLEKRKEHLIELQNRLAEVENEITETSD